jgi:hypothetical protein
MEETPSSRSLTPVEFAAAHTAALNRVPGHMKEYIWGLSSNTSMHPRTDITLMNLNYMAQM